MAEKHINLSLRVPAELADELRAEHRRTYPIHALSLNAWLISRIQMSFTIADEAVNPPQ